MMEAAGDSATPWNFYKATWHHSPGDGVCQKWLNWHFVHFDCCGISDHEGDVCHQGYKILLGRYL